MKIRFCLAVLLLLAAVSGCGRPQTEPLPEPVLPLQPEEPGFVMDGQPAETPFDYFDRTAIIERGEHLTGSFMQTVSWAKEYMTRRYPEGEIGHSYGGGNTLPKGMFRDELSAGVCLWNMTADLPGGAVEELPVQVFFFTETAESGTTQYLSGVLAGEDVLDRLPDCYGYLALDTRFAGRMQRLPEITAPEHTAVLQLERLEPEADGLSCYPLSETASALLVQTGEPAVLKLAVYDLTTGQKLGERELSPEWRFYSLENGVLTMENCAYSESGRREQLYVRLKEGQPVFSDGIRRENRWKVGSQTVEQRGNSLWLGETCLLEGSLDGAADDLRSFNVVRVLDDHRFLYGCYGWEWVEYYGVFDLTTGEDRMLTLAGDPRHNRTEQMPVINGTLHRALICEERQAGYWSFYDVDLDTVTRREIPFVFPVTDGDGQGMLTVNDAFTRMALLHSTPDGQWNLNVYDMESGAMLLSWQMPQAAVREMPEAALIGDGLVQVTLHKLATDSAWLYSIPYGVQ